MTVKEFWDSKDKLAIHCNTEEKANKLLKKFDELGKKWCSDRSYMERNNYRTYLDLTCYDNIGGFASKWFYEKNDYQVIEFDDFKKEKPKETIMKEETKTNCKFKVGDIAVANQLSNSRYSVTNKRNNYEGKVTKVSSDGFIRLDNKYLVNEECFDLKLKSKILTDKEFEYLGNVIKPFKDKVKHIIKVSDTNEYHITINMINDCAVLPNFPKNSSMYKGMEADEQYTLEELGFVEPKPTFKFKVGDVVKVVNGGLIYSTYSKWEGLTDELRFKYTNGQTVEEDREAIVRSVGEHGSVPNCLLCAIETLEGNVFIINERGLELIKEER